MTGKKDISEEKLFEIVTMYYQDEISHDELVEVVGVEEAEGYKLLKNKLNASTESLPEVGDIDSVYPEDFEPATSSQT